LKEAVMAVAPQLEGSYAFLVEDIELAEIAAGVGNEGEINDEAHADEHCRCQYNQGRLIQIIHTG
jgi:hypothetical protein